MMSRHFARIALFSLLMAGAGLLAAQTAAPAKPPAGKTLPASAAAETAPIERKRPVRNPELYSTTVELLSQGEAARNAAYARALVQVINQLYHLCSRQSVTRLYSSLACHVAVDMFP